MNARAVCSLLFVSLTFLTAVPTTYAATKQTKKVTPPLAVPGGIEKPTLDTSLDKTPLIKGGITELGGTALAAYRPFGLTCVKEGSTELPARVVAVTPATLAAERGVMAGDRVLQLHASKDGIVLTIERSGKDYRADLRALSASAATPMLNSSATTLGSNIDANKIALTHHIPKAAYSGWLKRTHPTFVLRANRIDPGTLIELGSCADTSSETLKAFGIPCTRLTNSQFNSYPLSKVSVLLLNSMSDLSPGFLPAIKQFVESGGYLIATGLELGTLAQCMPGYITAGDYSMQNYELVDAKLKNSDPILTKNTMPDATWECRAGTRTIKILSPSVHVIAWSQKLRQVDPASEGALAVSFRCGAGQVLYMLGSFDNTAGSCGDLTAPRVTAPFTPDELIGGLWDFAPAPVYVAMRQTIGANFIVEGLNSRVRRTYERQFGAIAAFSSSTK